MLCCVVFGVVFCIVVHCVVFGVVVLCCVVSSCFVVWWAQLLLVLEVSWFHFWSFGRVLGTSWGLLGGLGEAFSGLGGVLGGHGSIFVVFDSTRSNRVQQGPTGSAKAQRLVRS